MSNRTIKTEILIVGGGVAGASLAIRLKSLGHEVLVVEKDQFPRHKLCGEFVSPECLVQFQKLGVLDEMLEIGGESIQETTFYTENGRSLSVPSKWFFNGESGALGISRAEMDFRLLTRAREVGAEICEKTRVISINVKDQHIVSVSLRNETGEVTVVEANLFVDATGRARVLNKMADKTAKTKTRKRKIGHIAFKAHFEDAEIKQGVCEIYFFRGGYGGVNYVENGVANHCFLIESAVAREFGGDADRITEEVIFKNKRVAKSLGGAKRKFEWLAVSVEKFGRQSVSPFGNLVSVGDAAAFIDPFTGSGMLMALESSEMFASVLREARAVDKREIDYAMAIRRYLNEHHKATKNRLRACSVVRFLSSSPRIINLAVLLAGLNRYLLHRFTALTRPARNV